MMDAIYVFFSKGINLSFIQYVLGYYERVSIQWKVAAFAAGAVLFLFMWKKYKEGKATKVQALSLAAVFVYMFLVLASTVLSRSTRETYTYQLELFWSYRAWMAGSTIALWEIISNILMMMPYGFLLPLARGKKCAKMTILSGLGCSICIEILQLVLKRGLFEFDDMFHNTLGAALGYAVYRGITSQVKSKPNKTSSKTR